MKIARNTLLSGAKIDSYIMPICIFLTVSVVLISCSQNPFSVTIKISDILASPSKYGEKSVTVKGKVTESFILLGNGYFMLADSTGAIAVFPAKTYPKTGEEVTITGHVENAFVIGDKSLTVIIENTGGK